MKFTKVVEVFADIVQKSRSPKEIMENILLRKKQLDGIQNDITFTIPEDDGFTIKFEEDKYITYVIFQKIAK
jgi:hypothetical protein